MDCEFFEEIEQKFPLKHKSKNIEHEKKHRFPFWGFKIIRWTKNPLLDVDMS